MSLMIIPAYNEDKTINNVMEDLDRVEFLVIDDGFTDNTAEIHMLFPKKIGDKIATWVIGQP